MTVLKKDRVLLAKLVLLPLIAVLLSLTFLPGANPPLYVLVFLVPALYYGFWFTKRLTEEGMNLFSLEDPKEKQE